MAEETRALGPAGRVLMDNIRRIREAQRLTYTELAERLAGVGRTIPVLGLRRIESGGRRVDVDDLLALALVLNVAPVDLLVPGDARPDKPFPVAMNAEATTATVREWIRGEELLGPALAVDGFLSAEGDQAASESVEAWMTVPDAIRWMPQDRGRRVARRYYAEGEGN